MWNIWHPGWREKHSDRHLERQALRILECPRGKCRRLSRCTRLDRCAGERNHPVTAEQQRALFDHYLVALKLMLIELKLDPEGRPRAARQRARADRAREARAWARAKRRLGRG